MLFVDFKNPEKDYFECRRYFKPSNEEIEIGVEGDVNGPTELQKNTLSRLKTTMMKLQEQ